MCAQEGGIQLQLCPPIPTQHVIVVDRDTIGCQGYVRVLENRGHVVLLRHAYDEGWKLVRAPVRFDVGIIDLGVPGDEGLRLGLELVAHRLVKRLVFVTRGEHAGGLIQHGRLGALVLKETWTSTDVIIEEVERWRR